MPPLSANAPVAPAMVCAQTPGTGAGTALAPTPASSRPPSADSYALRAKRAGLAEPAAAEHGIAAVEDRRLAGCRYHRLLQQHARLFARSTQAGGHRHRAMPHLHQRVEL